MVACVVSKYNYTELRIKSDGFCTTDEEIQCTTLITVNFKLRLQPANQLIHTVKYLATGKHPRLKQYSTLDPSNRM